MDGSVEPFKDERDARDGDAGAMARRITAAQSRTTHDRAWRFQAGQSHVRRGRSITIVGVFDWEMAALGDPLVDLGILLAYWVPNASAAPQDSLTTVTTLPGWLTPSELVERYAARTNRDLARLKFYEVFALFKIAVVIQQIYFRFVHGQTKDPRFANFGNRVTYLAQRAASLL